MVQPAPMPKEAKTLIIVTMKSGNKMRIYSEHDPVYLIASSGEGFGLRLGLNFKDISGTFVVINQEEFSTIEFIPQEQPNATP